MPEGKLVKECVDCVVYMLIYTFNIPFLFYSISSSIEAVHVGSSPDEAAASSLTSAGALGDLHQTFMRPPSQHGLWRVEYNFTSLYDVPDITPTSMEDISMRLKNNKTWFDAYFRYMIWYDIWHLSCILDVESRNMKLVNISTLDVASGNEHSGWKSNIFLFGYDRLIAMLNAYYVNKIYTKLEDFKNCY